MNVIEIKKAMILKEKEKDLYENNDTLTSYENFQIKIISCLLSDKVFLQTIFDIINPSYFDSDGNKLLIKMIMGYFTEYKTKPTLDVLKVKIDKIDSDVLKVSVVKNLKEGLETNRIRRFGLCKK